MSMFTTLLGQLKARGLDVREGKVPGTLELIGPGHEKTPALVSAVRKFKPQFLRLLGLPESCGVCGRDVTDPVDRASLAAAANPLCDKGGNRATGEPRCPMKEEP